uniref:Uncharacterized protein n=1 Tax=Arundo donax TaxID=35708 RepID=A0A0A8Z7Y1_ARUDO
MRGILRCSRSGTAIQQCHLDRDHPSYMKSITQYLPMDLPPPPRLLPRRRAPSLHPCTSESAAT